MALQTNRIDICGGQELLVASAVGYMACHAASFGDGRVLINERSCKSLVTLEAHQIFLSGRSRLLSIGSGMWNMAIGALYGLLIYFMMNGHGELPFDVSVTLKAETRLRYFQEFFFFTAVDCVTLDAAYVAHSVS